MNLRPTHHGYAYQDILTGIALVDLMLGTAATVRVDLKDFGGDRFDDLTIDYAAGHRVRLQIKHTTTDRELARSTFSSDGRGLRLDRLLRALLDDLAGNPRTTYRIVVRDGYPDGDLTTVLAPVEPADDPSDPLPGVTTRRYQFDPQKLRDTKPWKKLLGDFSGEELNTACARMYIDTAAPAATLSFSAPGPAESALLRRATEELGAGRPPNTNRAAEDVALALTHAATAARAIDGHVIRTAIAPELRLATDFGAVREGHPVEPAFAVERVGAADVIRVRIDTAAPAGGRVVLTGEPGAGKSWLCEQIADAYRGDDWIVLRHHCWLGQADSDRNERVLADVVIGSLLNQLEAVVPDAFADLRPRFAATAETLEAAIRACRTKHPDRQVLLIVDGLDHVDRVVGRHVGGGQVIDPSRALVDQLAAIDLPDDACLLIASQPGEHLDTVVAGGATLQLPRMLTEELRALAQRHRVFENPETGAPAEPADERTIVDLLEVRSNGNALYATYLCRYATGASPLDEGTPALATVAGLIERLNQVPENAKDLNEYYRHLLSSLTDGQEIAIGALAICDFALTEQELGQVVPSSQLVLKSALARLAPVLNSQPGLGGLKVHHESFSRYIRQDKPEEWVKHIRRTAADWLIGRGFVTDTRAFRHLPQLLADLDDYDHLKVLVDPEFVTKAIAALQPPGAVKVVLSVVANQAQARLDWPTLMTCLEARRAVTVYEHEALPDTLVEYADVVVGILGADVVAERLMYEGRTTFTARWGLGLCEAVDGAGVAAPWDAYIAAHTRESETDNTSYGSDSDDRLDLATQLGHLRLRTEDKDPIDTDELAVHFEDHEGTPPLQDLVPVFASGLPAGEVVKAARAMTDAAKAATVFIALADLASNGVANLPPAQELAREAWNRAPDADISRYLYHGIDPGDVLAGLGITNLESNLRSATQTVLEERSADRPALVAFWLDLLRLAHGVDHTTPNKLNADLAGAGFYRAWLRFAVATVGISEELSNGKLAPESASQTVRVALEQLAAEAKPFTGKPRAVDLWSIRYLIHDVIECALRVVQPEDLNTVLGYVTTIGNGTTSSLMGMAETGPLTTNDLLAILSRVADHIGVEPIHKLLPAVRDARNDMNTMYSVTADFEVATARICLNAGATAEANDCWERASRLLGAYGGHKDPTISEFITAVEDLASVDIDAARAALARLQDPAYLVRQHTDGRGTGHVPTSWWELAANIDPNAAATDAAALLTSEYGFEDYCAHAAQAELLTIRPATADPVALAALRLTIGPDWRQPGPDADILARLRTELGTSSQGDVALAVFATNVAATYDNQAVSHASDVPKTMVTSELVEAVQQLGGPLFPVREPRPEHDNNARYHGDPTPAPGALKELLDSAQRPLLPEGPRGAVLAARDYDNKSYDSDPDAPRWNLDALANAIGWRILEVTLADGAAAGKSVLDSVARELHAMSDQEIFAVLAEGIARHCNEPIPGLEQVASYCYTLAYIRIRGGGGWRTFAGRERVDLWTKAHALHADTAEQTLAGAIAGNIAAESQGTYGMTQAVVAAFAAQPASGPGGSAPEVWDAAFTVLERRVPGVPGRSHPHYVPTPSPDSLDDVNVALATLAIASISRPKREDIRLALLGTVLLISCRPVLAQSALIPVLGAGLDAGRITWLLETFRDYLQQGELTDALASQLTKTAQSDRLSVRVTAAEILELHNRAVPDPPATDPDAALRFGIAKAIED